MGAWNGMGWDPFWMVQAEPSQCYHYQLTRLEVIVVGSEFNGSKLRTIYLWATILTEVASKSTNKLSMKYGPFIIPDIGSIKLWFSNIFFCGLRNITTKLVARQNTQSVTNKCNRTSSLVNKCKADLIKMRFVNAVF